MEKKNMEFQPTFLRICVDDADMEADNIAGRICGVGLEDSYPFSGTSELRLLIDRCLDQIGQASGYQKGQEFSAGRRRGCGILPESPVLSHYGRDTGAKGQLQDSGY